MKFFKTLLGTIGLLLLVPSAHAVGTAAGTTIFNEATVSYQVSGAPATTTASDSILVDELIDVTVGSQDAANVPVNTPSTDQVLTFLVTNTGNGSEPFELNVSNRAGDQFDVTNLEVYLDDGDGIFNAGTDTLFTPGAGGDTVTLDANDPATDDQLVFVIADVPGGRTDGDLADVELEAVSLTARTEGLNTEGATAVGQGDGGVDAVVDASVGRDTDQGTFIVTSISVTITKTSSVADPFGGSLAVPGSVITYTLTVTVDGSGTATALTVSDPIPANTTYDSQTIAVDSGSGPVAQDDADDGGDLAYFEPSAGADGTVFVELGDVSGSPTATFVITFDVVID